MHADGFRLDLVSTLARELTCRHSSIKIRWSLTPSHGCRCHQAAKLPQDCGRNGKFFITVRLEATINLGEGCFPKDCCGPLRAG